jgi:hypothetical protein
VDPDGVKLQGDPAVLDKYYRFVTTGIRRLGFVRTDPKIPDLTSLRWNFRNDLIRRLI